MTNLGLDYYKENAETVCVYGSCLLVNILRDVQ
jgi:hypothetical protein